MTALSYYLYATLLLTARRQSVCIVCIVLHAGRAVLYILFIHGCMQADACRCIVAPRSAQVGTVSVTFCARWRHGMLFSSLLRFRLCV